ncbi:MAG: hypothetical protein K2Y56_06610 [Methylobacterium sp.]|uniref:hypothetical protein n=1 Tax=Methylobacterium sp. TaxID=409 RepID=UPI0025E2750F|nr:hypothetical protein [Methylobacterium sp.]MBX9931194.1 hypothetical protein [Methylobacterium sp.]
MVPSRRVYVLFGTTGITFHLAWKVFEDGLLFPFALSLIGLATIGAGILYRRHSVRIGQAIHETLPGLVIRLKPRHAME